MEFTQTVHFQENVSIYVVSEIIGLLLSLQLFVPAEVKS